MDKIAIQDYTLKIIEKIASLQQVLLEVSLDNPEDKQKILANYYDLADSFLQLEEGIVTVYDISQEDVDLFEERNFLKSPEITE